MPMRESMSLERLVLVRGMNHTRATLERWNEDPWPVLRGWLGSTLAAQYEMSPALLLVGILPHALPELMALFLPLAAWVIASRRGRWNELLAATFVTVAIAIPTLIVSSLVELWVSPRLILALAA